MSRHMRALGIKALIVIFSAVLTPMFTDLPVSSGIIIGVFLSAIAYVLVDLLLLPAAGNAATTAADAALAALVYWAGIRLAGGTGLSAGELLFFIVLVGVAEWFLHKYLIRFVLNGRKV